MNTETQRLHVVLDTNILISALMFGGKPSSILLLAANKQFALFTSASILEELERVLKSKFKWNSPDTNEAVELTQMLTTVVRPIERVTEIIDDDSDNRVLECALACGAEYIVSGDQHLLKLKTFRSIKIVTADEFLNLVSTS